MSWRAGSTGVREASVGGSRVRRTQSVSMRSMPSHPSQTLSLGLAVAKETSLDAWLKYSAQRTWPGMRLMLAACSSR
jgi:hypothetical protein